MTLIRLEKQGRRMRVSACGHAVGSPAACAGVSALLCALCGYLRQEETAKLHRCRLESGDALLEFSGGERASAAFELTAVGLRQIAIGYPACVRIEE